MGNDVYTFDRQNQIGRHGENVLDTLFAGQYHITRATPEQQRQGIDRIFHKPDGTVSLVEYKTDQTAARTGKAFIEVVSRDMPPARSGWVWTSQADRIVYYVPGLGDVYILNPDSLRKHINASIRDMTVKVAPNPKYNTYGVLVPLAALRELATGIYSITASDWEAA